MFISNIKSYLQILCLTDFVPDAILFSEFVHIT